MGSRKDGGRILPDTICDRETGKEASAAVFREEELNAACGAIRGRLAALAEPEYAAFASRLLKKPGEEKPSGSAARVLGVRLPALRKLARKLARENWRLAWETLSRNQTESFEEIMLRGFLIGCVRVWKPCADLPEREEKGKPDQETVSLEELFALTAGFVPLIDNWSLCDSFCASLKFAREYPEQTWEFLKAFLRSEEEFAVRFGLVMILNYFITDAYADRLFPVFDAVRHEGYYVKMANAWAISICYVRYPVRTEAYLKQNRLDDFTFQKALQKIVESRCISEETGERIRGLRR